MKVPDAVIKVKDLDLVEMLDSIQTILNNGLYEMRIFSSIPDWIANDGESGIYVSGDIRQLYFSLNGIWTSIGFNSLGTLVLFDNDGDTGITPEATTDEDILRFYTAGYYNFAMGTFGFAMAAGLPIFFDGINGDTRWVYDTSDNYLKGYVDNIKRIEM